MNPNRNGTTPTPEALSEERLGKLVGGKKAYIMAMVAEQEESEEASRAEALLIAAAAPEDRHHGVVFSKLNPQRRLLDKKTFPVKRKHLVRWAEEQGCLAAAAAFAATPNGVKGEGGEAGKKGEDVREGSVADVVSPEPSSNPTPHTNPTPCTNPTP